MWQRSGQHERVLRPQASRKLRLQLCQRFGGNGGAGLIDLRRDGGGAIDHLEVGARLTRKADKGGRNVRKPAFDCVTAFPTQETRNFHGRAQPVQHDGKVQRLTAALQNALLGAVGTAIGKIFNIDGLIQGRIQI